MYLYPPVEYNTRSRTRRVRPSIVFECVRVCVNVCVPPRPPSRGVGVVDTATPGPPFLLLLLASSFHRAASLAPAHCRWPAPAAVAARPCPRRRRMSSSAATAATLRAAVKKLAAGLHVPQTASDVDAVVGALSQRMDRPASLDPDDDPDVDIAVHRLQSLAPAPIEFATQYEKLTARGIPGLGELVKAAAVIADNSALRQLVAGGPALSVATDTAPAMPPEAPADPRLARVAAAPPTVLSPSTWGQMQAVASTAPAPAESPSSLMAELARFNLGRVPGRQARAAAPGASAPPVDPVAGTPLAITFGRPVSLRSRGGAFLNAVRTSTGDVALVLAPRPTGPWAFANAAFRDDAGAVQYGDVLTIKLTADHPVDAGTPLALVADAATATVVLQPRARGGTDRFSLAAADHAAPAAATVASCGQVVVRASTGQYLAAGAAGAFPVLADAPEPWHVVHYHAPFVVPRRSALLPGDCGTGPSSAATTVPLGSYPIQTQELLLVEDVLYALIGIDGKYIACDGADGPTLRPDTTRGVDPSLAFLLRRCLPIVASYARVRRYVESHGRYEYGMTCHALCAAVRSLLKEFVILVAQLEHQRDSPAGLPLQRLFFYLQPSTHTLAALDALVVAAGNATGGALLDVLGTLRQNGGDRPARVMYEYLWKKAAVPFYEMLTRWVHDGAVDDPFAEFMVAVNESQRAHHLVDDFNTRYWEERYTVRAAMVPSDLRPCAQQILVAGKYWNVLRSVPGAAVARDDAAAAAPLVPGLVRENVRAIEDAFARAARALLDLLLVTHRLMPRLRALKHYFLVDQGDYFLHFMHTAEDELRKECAAISTGKLESLLEASITVSVLGDEEFRDSLRCTLLPYTLIQHLELVQQLSSAAGDFEDETAMEATRAKLQRVRHQRLKGMEAFALDYDVQWPLSLVISRKELTKYQLVFRHLFFCNHVQRQLAKTWLGHQSLKEMDLRGGLTSSYVLRQRMLHFMQNFVYYMMVEVLEVRHHQFETAVLKAGTMDEILEFHAEFLDTCLKECLLSHHELLRCVTKIMSVCLLFSEQMEHFYDANRLDELLMDDAESTHRREGRRGPSSGSNVLHARRTRLTVQSQQIRSIVTKPEYARMIERFGKNFDDTLGVFMRKMIELARGGGEYQSHIANLVVRLDYNGFYSSYLGLYGEGGTSAVDSRVSRVS